MINFDANGNSVADRPDGWYWVCEKNSSGTMIGDWVPAKWISAARCWYSVDFFGMPDYWVAIGARIERPA